MPAEQARPQGRTRVTPQDFVLAASFRGDPVDVVLGVFGWRTRRSRRGPVAEVRIVRTRAPSFRAHGNDPTRPINRANRRRLVEVSHPLVWVST
jgi:hypothetical protein